jgi:ribosomal protein S25
MREKRDNKVVFNKNLYEKAMKEIPKKMKVITVYSLIEAYKINGSLARRTVKELLGKGI